jgi:hypothetical protein
MRGTGILSSIMKYRLSFQMRKLEIKEKKRSSKMWQIIVSIYMVVSMLSCVLIWAALAQSKIADQRIESHSDF